MRTYPVRSVGFLLALGALGALACDQGMTDSAQHSRVVLDLRPVLGVLGGDFVSVLDTARLTITSDGQQQTMTSLFGTGDSETTFDVSLKSGPATFIFDAISTNGTPLYRGQATSTIDGDGFAVTITPQADTAVMVVYPRRPTFDTITVVYNDVDHPALRATLNVRNPGSATLNWHVASIPPLPTGFIAITCAVPSRQADCLEDVTWTATTDEVILVTFIMSTSTTSLPAQNIGFFSDVGELTVVTAPFAAGIP